MKRFELRIAMDNAAFEDDPGELVRILRALCNSWDLNDGMQGKQTEGWIRDVNGNSIGGWKIVTRRGRR